jgi:hypothetical protein
VFSLLDRNDDPHLASKVSIARPPSFIEWLTKFTILLLGEITLRLIGMFLASELAPLLILLFKFARD